MALPTTGSLSIMDGAGTTRSIAREVDGNVTGTKSLTTLSVSAGKTAPHSMLEFYGYASSYIGLTTTSVFLTPYYNQQNLTICSSHSWSVYCCGVTFGQTGFFNISPSIGIPTTGHIVCVTTNYTTSNQCWVGFACFCNTVYDTVRLDVNYNSF